MLRSQVPVLHNSCKMLFSFLTFQSHAALFRSQGPGETGDHFNIRTAVVETYQNTSRKEWIYRIVQSIAIVIVFCIILASLVTTAGDGDETPTGWWIYVIILVRRHVAPFQLNANHHPEYLHYSVPHLCNAI